MGEPRHGEAAGTGQDRIAASLPGSHPALPERRRLLEGPGSRTPAGRIQLSYAARTARPVILSRAVVSEPRPIIRMAERAAVAAANLAAHETPLQLPEGFGRVATFEQRVQFRNVGL